MEKDCRLKDPRAVIAGLRRPDDALLLLDHPRASRMTCAGGSFSYLDPVSNQLKRLRGLTSILRQHFWPNDRPWGGGGGAAQKLPRDKTQKPKRPQNPDEAATGHVRGSIIHGQIHDLLTLDAGSLARRHPYGLHPWTKRVVAEFRRRQWAPIATEYMVAAESAGLGTAIDSVCVRPDGTVLFIELKSSASWRLFFNVDEEARSLPAEPMTGSLAGHLDNTPFNRAQVQAMAGALMAIYGVGLKSDFETWVVHVDPYQVDCVQVAREHMLTLGPLIWSQLLGGSPPPPPPPEQPSMKRKRQESRDPRIKKKKKTTQRV